MRLAIKAQIWTS